MLKPIVMLGSAGILVASTLGLSVPGSLGSNPLMLLKQLPEVDAEFNQAFCGEFLGNTNAMRVGFAVDPLKSDPEIQEFVANFLNGNESPETIELNTVFDTLQEQFPGAQYLAANLVSAVSRDELLAQLTSWDELAHPEFHDASTSVIKSGRRLVALSVLSRRIPEFTVEAANQGGGRFFNRCPHCNSVHALDLNRKSKTLILSCPDCERPYDVLAADAKGMMRRAKDFLTGFQVPGVGLIDASKDKKENILLIWKQVADRCTYEHDLSDFNESEVWKTSDDTWVQKQGDCEDTSILLVDSLISAGYEARVAIGWNGNIGQHAWVVVKIDGEQYVIESTIQDNPGLADLVPVKDASPFYRPEQLFDRQYLYFQNDSPDKVAMNYFADSAWKRIN
ncbi:MAG: transglutaminase-like domain-containing protein [Verrucomicrobiales bacterium]|nr:transglutaminase-like domain-containing protein [Verrucomicrobiales bacterium]